MLPTLRKLLYASDLGDNARSVFAYTVALARKHDATIDFLHVMEPMGSTARSLVRNILPKEELERMEADGLAHVRQEIQERIDDFCTAELGSDPDAHDIVSDIYITEGYPAEVILNQARDSNADLIVMGSHSRKGLQRALVGSVAHKVIGHATRPVFLVPIADDVA